MSEENVKAVKKVSTSEQIKQLEARIESLEQNTRSMQDIFFEAFEMLAEEVRPVFGWGAHIANLYQAVANRIKKELLKDE